MGHRPSSGQPYSNPGNPDDLYFSVGGDAPKPVQQRGGASTEGAEPDQSDSALGELGAGIRSKKSSSSSKSRGKAPISFETDSLMRNLTNRPK